VKKLVGIQRKQTSR